MSIQDEARAEFRFTDAEWREYQAMPEQGYSHRGKLEFFVNRWLASRKPEVAPSDTDREALRKALRDVLTGASVQGDSERGADAVLAAGFSRSQPVQVEVTDMADSIRDRHYAVEIEPSDTICGACSMRLPNGKYFGKLVEWPCDAVQLATALGGGETNG